MDALDFPFQANQTVTIKESNAATSIGITCFLVVKSLSIKVPIKNVNANPENKYPHEKGKS